MEEQKKRKLGCSEGTGEKRQKPSHPATSLKNHPDIMMFVDATSSDKNEEKLKLQAAEEQRNSNLQSIKQHREYIEKQKSKIQILKERLKSYDSDAEKTNNFKEVSEYYSILEKKTSDIKKQLNSVRLNIGDLQNSYYEMKFGSGIDTKQVENMTEFMRKLQIEKTKVEQKAKDQAEKFNLAMKESQKRLSSIDMEKLNVQVLFDEESDKLKQKIEMRFQHEKDLMDLNTIYQNLLLEKEKRIKDAGRMKNKLEEELEEKVKELNLLKSQTEELCEQIGILNLTLEKSHETLKSLSDLLDDKNHKIQVFKHDLASLQQDIKKKESDLKLFEDKLAEKEAEVNKLSDEKTKMLQISTENTKKLKNLQESLKAKENELETLSADKINYADVHISNLNRIKFLKEKLERFEASQTKISNQLSQEIELQSSTTNQLNELQSKIQKLELEVREKGTDKENCIKEKEKIKVEKQVEIEKLQSKIENLMGDFEKYNQLSKELIVQHNNLKEEKKKLTINCSENTKKAQIAEQKLAQAKTSLQKLNEVYYNVEDELSKQKMELNRLRTDKEAFQTSLPNSTNSKYTEMLERRRKEFERLKKENKRLEALNLKAEKERLQNRFKELNEKIATAKGKIASITSSEDAIPNAEKELTEKKKKCKILNDALVKKNSTIEKTREELSKVEDELNKVKSTNNDYEVMLHNFEQKYKSFDEKCRAKNLSILTLQAEMSHLKKESVLQSHQEFLQSTQLFENNQHFEDDILFAKSSDLRPLVSSENLDALLNKKIVTPSNSFRLFQEKDNVLSGIGDGQNKENDDVYEESEFNGNEKSSQAENPLSQNYDQLSCEERFELMMSQPSQLSQKQSEKKTDKDEPKPVKTYLAKGKGFCRRK